MFINYYEVLGVSHDATADEVLSAYRERAKAAHPDVNKSPDADAEMTNVNAAYETLRDSAKRAVHDRQIEEEMRAAEERRRRNRPEVYIDYIGDELRDRLDNMFGYQVRRRTGFHTYLAEIRTNFHTPDGRPINVMVSLNTENQRVEMAETETIPKVFGSHRVNAGAELTSVSQLELGYRQIFGDARQNYGVWTDNLKLRLDCDSLEAVPESLFSMVQAVQYISSKADLAERETRHLEESLRNEMPEILQELFSYQLDEDGHLEVATNAKMPNGQQIKVWWIPATDETSLPMLTDWGKTFKAVAKHNEEIITDCDRLLWEEANEIYGTGTKCLNDKEETLSIIKEVPVGEIADSVLSMMQAIGYIASRAMRTRDPQYFIDRGNSRWMARRTDEAVSDFDRAIALEPQDASAYCHRANVYLTKRQPGRAIKDLDIAISVNDRYGWAYKLRAAANEQLGRDSEAIEDWSRAIQLLPQSAESYYRRGAIYFEDGRLEDAIRDLDALIALDQKHFSGYLLRAEVKEQQGNSEEAIEDLSEAIRINPYHAYHAKRGALFSKMGQYEKAMADYESAWKGYPSRRDYKEQWERNRELLRDQRDRDAKQGKGNSQNKDQPRRSRLDTLEGR